MNENETKTANEGTVTDKKGKRRKMIRVALILGGVVVGSVLLCLLIPPVGAFLKGTAVACEIAAPACAAAAGAAGSCETDESASCESDGYESCESNGDESCGANEPIDDKEQTKRDYTRPTEPFDVDSHVVNLGEGRHPSKDKIETAADNGFPDLTENQTWRKGFRKYDSQEMRA